MKMKKILFPTDFSHNGDAALAFATALARDMGAKLLIVHVEEPATAYGGGEFYYGVPEPAHAELRSMLEQVVPADTMVGYEHHLVAGDPAAAIVDLAAKQGVELIVMATHGRRGISRMVMGSVAELVVRRAKCPVLTYKQPALEPAVAAH
jgi:nucleotide-binding universal stress UspA family protein